MFSRIAVLVLTLGTSPLAAEEINIDWAFPTWPAGSTFQLKSGDSFPHTHTTMGREDLGYRVDVTRQNGTLDGTYWTDEKGQTTAWRSAGETPVDLYVPHDCTATLGPCTYSEQAAGGDPATMIRTTTAIEGGVEFTIADESGAVILTGTWMLDDQGFVTTGWTEYPDGDRIDVAMIGTAVKAN
jgi:hypothetical protein